MLTFGSIWKIEKCQIWKKKQKKNKFTLEKQWKKLTAKETKKIGKNNIKWQWNNCRSVKLTTGCAAQNENKRIQHRKQNKNMMKRGFKRDQTSWNKESQRRTWKLQDTVERCKNNGTTEIERLLKIVEDIIQWIGEKQLYPESFEHHNIHP